MKKNKAEAVVYVLMLFTENDVCSVLCSSITQVVNTLFDDLLIHADYHEGDDIIFKNKSDIRKFIIEITDYGYSFDYANLLVSASDDELLWFKNKRFQIEQHKMKLEVKLARS